MKESADKIASFVDYVWSINYSYAERELWEFSELEQVLQLCLASKALPSCEENGVS